MPKAPDRGRLKCFRCDRVLESTAGRSLDAALVCSLTTLLLLIPANFMILMTVHVAGITRSTHLAEGLLTSWHQGWHLLTLVLGLQGIILPFVRFALLSATLTAIRFGASGPWMGTAFRYSEKLDVWAMADVLLIGAGIGYGRIAAKISVAIGIGGWCFVGAAFMTMITRASLDRRAVWRRLEIRAPAPGPNPIACTYCDLVLPAETEGNHCPRCRARVHRRRPFAVLQCAALTVATFALTPIAYGFPMSALWEGGLPHPHTIIDGIRLLFVHGFWYFGVVIFLVSVLFPFTKLFSLSWSLISVHRRSTVHLLRKTKLYRFVDEVGRWSCLDPFTVMIFAPMVQFRQEAHIDFMGGSAAFLATVVLSMIAARAFDPRLMWDAADPRVSTKQSRQVSAVTGADRHAPLVIPAQAGIVREQAQLIKEVKVRLRKTYQPVAGCNCAAARQGGKQQQANEPSVG